jgi:hypothetical protein
MAIEVKVGDVVHVRGTVDRMNHAANCIDVSFGAFPAVAPYSHWIRADCIVHVEPPPIKVGDRVHAGNPTVVYTIKAIDGDAAWLWSDATQGHYTVRFDALKRA